MSQSNRFCDQCGAAIPSAESLFCNMCGAEVAISDGRPEAQQPPSQSPTRSQPRSGESPPSLPFNLGQWLGLGGSQPPWRLLVALGVIVVVVVIAVAVNSTQSHGVVVREVPARVAPNQTAPDAQQQELDSLRDEMQEMKRETDQMKDEADQMKREADQMKREADREADQMKREADQMKREADREADREESRRYFDCMREGGGLRCLK